MPITANLITTVLSLIFMLSAAMDTPPAPNQTTQDEKLIVRDNGGLQDEGNAEMIDAMWEKLRDYFSANKEDADEFWWQAAVDEPDRILERFLQGNGSNVSTAVVALIKSLEWRRTEGVRDLVYNGERSSDRIPRACFESGKGIFWGYDKEGYLVIYLYPRRHTPPGFMSATRTLQNLQNQKHIIYETELGRRLFQAGRDKVTVLIDLEGLSVYSMDFSCALFVVMTLRYYYPEAINKIVLININGAYETLYTMVSPFIQFIMKKLIKVNSKAELLDVFDQEILLAEFGGDSTYKYEYVAPVDDRKVMTLECEKCQDLLKTADACASSFYATGDPIFKSKLRNIYKQLDNLIYPGDLYTRIGVINEDGCVKWGGE